MKSRKKKNRYSKKKHYSKKNRYSKKNKLKKLYGGNCVDGTCCKIANKIIMSDSGRIDTTDNYLNVDPNKNCKYYALTGPDGNYYALRKRNFGSKSNSHCTNKNIISGRFGSKYLEIKCSPEKNDILKKQFKDSKDKLSEERRQDRENQLNYDTQTAFHSQTGIKTYDDSPRLYRQSSIKKSSSDSRNAPPLIRRNSSNERTRSSIMPSAAYHPELYNERNYSSKPSAAYHPELYI